MIFSSRAMLYPPYAGSDGLRINAVIP